MATVTPGYTFSSNEVVTPAKLNSAATPAISNIVNADIASNAAIADSKLATIATAGKVSNSATTATSANTASTIVLRDASGNFSAGTITASLSGNVTGNVTGTVSAIADGAVSSAQKISNGVISAEKLNGNQTGTAPIYGCRAWVNFDGTKDTTGAASTTNTNRLIRASGNVSSVLRNGLGDYTINFTTPLPNANYAINLTSTQAGSDESSSANVCAVKASASNAYQLKTASAVRIISSDNNTDGYRDAFELSATVFC